MVSYDCQARIEAISENDKTPEAWFRTKFKTLRLKYKIETNDPIAKEIEEFVLKQISSKSGDLHLNAVMPGLVPIFDSLTSKFDSNDQIIQVIDDLKQQILQLTLDKDELKRKVEILETEMSTIKKEQMKQSNVLLVRELARHTEKLLCRYILDDPTTTITSLSIVFSMFKENGLAKGTV